MKRLILACALALLAGCIDVPATHSSAEEGNSGGGEPARPVVERPVPAEPVRPAVKSSFASVDEALTALSLAVASSHNDQTRAAERWLSGQGRAAVPKLVAEVQDESAELGYRLAACRTLGTLGTPATSALIELTDYDQPNIRLKAISYLGVIKPPEKRTVDTLIALIDHDDSDVAVYAIRALAKIGSPAKAAAERLIALRNSDAEEKLRLAAADALKEVAPRRTMAQ